MAFSKTLMSLALATSLTATAAPASVFLEPKSVKVAYDDLNLASIAGRKKLDERIERAVRQVCRNDSGYGTFQSRTSAKCEAETRISAKKISDQRVAEYQRDNPRQAGVQTASTSN